MILETERLIIRKFVHADAEIMYLQSNEETAKKELPDEVLPSIEAAERKIIFFNEQYQNGKILVYAIVLKETGAVLGHISLSPVKGGVEIGYFIGEAFRNKGYAYEAAKAFTLWALKSAGLEKIYGIVKSENKDSIRVLEKCDYEFIEEKERNFFGEIFLMRTYLFSGSGFGIS